MKIARPFPIIAASIATVLLLNGCASRKSLPPTPAPAPAPVETPAPPPLPSAIDRILVDKDERRMVLYKDGRVVRRYIISLGRNPEGHKRQAGDGRTPEGVYAIELRNDHSRFYRSLKVSYPNREDRARAAAQGVPPGGDIMIHGLPNGKGWIGTGQRGLDWTEGCIALTNEEMDELWRVVKPGTPIEIRA